MSWFQSKFMHFYTFGHLFKGLHTMRKAAKNPQVWVKTQNKAIRKYIKEITKIPYIRRMFVEAGVSPGEIREAKDFCRLPLMTKTEYREMIAEMQETNPAQFQTALKRETSGSTGEPLALYTQPGEMAADIANQYRHIMFQNVGFPLFRGTILSCMTGGVQSHSFVQKLGLFRVVSISAVAPSAENFRVFQATKPDFVYGVKTGLLRLAQYVNETKKICPPPRACQSVSEKLSDEERDCIETAFGTKVFDLFGCVETGGCMLEQIPVRHKMHIWHDTHVVNVVDENGDLVESGQGRLVLTSLCKKSFPIFNYAVGDVVETETQDGIRTITSISGRMADEILCSDGATFTWMNIYVIVKIPGLLQYQVVQNEIDRIIFHVVPSFADPAEKDRIAAALIQNTQNICFGKIKAEVRFVESLPQAKSGKVKLIQCNIPRKEDA